MQTAEKKSTPLLFVKLSENKAEHQEADEHQHLMLPIGERPMGMIWHDLEAIIALFCEEPVASGRPVRYSELAAFLITSAPLDGDLNVLLDHEARHANSSLNPCASTSKSMSRSR